MKGWLNPPVGNGQQPSGGKGGTTTGRDPRDVSPRDRDRDRPPPSYDSGNGARRPPAGPPAYNGGGGGANIPFRETPPASRQSLPPPRQSSFSQAGGPGFTSPPLSPRSSMMMGQGAFSPPGRGGSGDARRGMRAPAGNDLHHYNDYNDYNDDSPLPDPEPPARKPFSQGDSSRSDGRRRSFGSGGQGDDGGFDGARSSTSTTATSYEKEKRAKPDLGEREMGGAPVELQLGLPGEGDEGVFGEGMVYISRIIQEKDSYKKRVAELENDIQLSRMERASFIEQINKQFKEEEKLLATVQTMKNEFEELRSTYTQTVSKLQDSRDPSIVEMIREENTILKDKLKSIEGHGGDVKGLDFSSLPAPRGGDKASDTELKLKRAMEEKKMLIAALNESMNNASRLERENAQLQEVENRLRNGMDGKSTPESIIRQIELNGSSVLMYTCTRLQDKIAILGAAIATHNPNVIMTVILYLRDTLSQLHLFEILADPKHAVALSQYRHLLAQCGYESELAQLYHFLEWPQKEGMFMLRQAFRIKNPTERMNALLLCMDFFGKHESLQWYGEQLQQKVNSLAYLRQQPEPPFERP